MKQTAVEWLAELIECGADLEQLKKCLPKAKAIEKEQIENAFNYGQFDLGMEADEYYNETFKS